MGGNNSQFKKNDNNNVMYCKKLSKSDIKSYVQNAMMGKPVYTDTNNTDTDIGTIGLVFTDDYFNKVAHRPVPNSKRLNESMRVIGIIRQQGGYQHGGDNDNENDNNTSIGWSDDGVYEGNLNNNELLDIVNEIQNGGNNNNNNNFSATSPDNDYNDINLDEININIENMTGGANNNNNNSDYENIGFGNVHNTNSEDNTITSSVNFSPFHSESEKYGGHINPYMPSRF